MEHLGRLSACPKCQTPLRVIASDTHENVRINGKLLIESGPGRVGERIYLGTGQALSVGKSPDNHLRLRSPGVSRVHCRLIPNHDRWRVEDDNSTNGLFVNGHRTHDRDLCDGDLIRIGDFELRFSANEHRHRSSGATAIAAIGSGHDTFNELELGQTGGATATDAPIASGDDEGGFTFIDAESKQSGSRPGGSPGTQPFTCPKCATPLATGARICVQCGFDVQAGRRVKTVAILKADKPAMSSGIGAYLADCARSAAFIGETGNLISFLMLALLAAFGELVAMMPAFFCLVAFIIWVVTFIVNGLICAYMFNVVINAASGEESLPDIGLTGDWVDDIIVPFFKFLATWLIALIPFFIYMQSIGWSGGTTEGYVITLGIGVISWPMIMLIAAIGTIDCFLRPDQIVMTIVRTFVPYLVTLLATGFAFGINLLLQFGLEGAIASMGGNRWAALTVLWLLNLYLTIVAMRCIGLYYHHFKDRFAWSWG